MLCKVGMNTNGVGVCLNKLSVTSKSLFLENGVPVHILLRLALECDSLQSIEKSFRMLKHNTGSSIVAGDSNHRYINFEFLGENLFTRKLVNLESDAEDEVDFFYRTNHYLLSENLMSRESLANSYSRFERLQCLIQQQQQQQQQPPQQQHVDRIAQLLRDPKVFVEYFPLAHHSHLPGGGIGGTVATIIMQLSQQDLGKGSGEDRSMHVRMHQSASFLKFSL